MNKLPPRDPLVPDELPGRWPDEDISPQKQKTAYSIERALSGDEAEYQQDLEKMLKREEEQQDRNIWEGDLLGMEDGRPGLSLGMGADGPTLFGFYTYNYWVWRLLIGAVILVAAFIFRSCYHDPLTQPGPGAAPAGAGGAPAPGQPAH